MDALLIQASFLVTAESLLISVCDDWIRMDSEGMDFVYCKPVQTLLDNN